MHFRLSAPMFLLAACSTDCTVWADAVPLTSASATAQLHNVFDMSPPCARSEIQRHRPVARRRLWLNNDVSQPFCPRLFKRSGAGREGRTLINETHRELPAPSVVHPVVPPQTRCSTPTIPARWRSV